MAYRAGGDLVSALPAQSLTEKELSEISQL
jgi:hypothetical protein